jgi:dTMP kinase
MEHRDLDFHRRVHAGFHREAELAPERIYVVDATQPVKQVQTAIWQEVQRRLQIAA